MGKTVPCPTRRAPPAASDSLQAPLTPPALHGAAPFSTSTPTSATMTEGADPRACGRVSLGGGRPEQASRPTPEDVAPLTAPPPPLILLPLLPPAGCALFWREGKAGGEDPRSHLSPKNHITFALARGGAEPCETLSAPVARGGRPPARARPYQHIMVLGDKGYHVGSCHAQTNISREAFLGHLADTCSATRTDGSAAGAPRGVRDASLVARDAGGRASSGVRDPSESNRLLSSSGNSWTHGRCPTAPTVHEAGVGAGDENFVGNAVSASASASSPIVRTFSASPGTQEGSFAHASRSPPTAALPSDRRSPGSAWHVVFLLLVASLHARVGVLASEFPDRECCDSAPPPPPHYHTTTSTTPVPRHRPTTTTTTTPAPPSFFPTSSVPPTGESCHSRPVCSFSFHHDVLLMRTGSRVRRRL